ncbi:MAG: GNAT family N-acetyltransferase [Propionibacteriaceae bacterium]
MLSYPPLQVSVSTPRLELCGATDELLTALVPAVRNGEADADPLPYDDPMSLYEEDPDLRVHRWLEGVWRGRGAVRAGNWRLPMVVLVDGRPVGMQDLIADNFNLFGTVVTFSWLASSARRRGLGREMRAAVLQLAFDGFRAKEAASDAFEDNRGSNSVSETMGYTRNGTDWETRRGEPALLQRWRITRAEWEPRRRADIRLDGVEECRGALLR